MNPAKYLYTSPHPTIPGQVIMCTLPKASVVTMPENSAKAVIAGNVPIDAAQQLERIGVMVADSEAEKEQMFKFYEQMNLLNKTMRVAIILGLDCNFNCRYCYEGSMKETKQQMNEDTAIQLVKFLHKRFIDKDKKKLTLDFYGGEPLLSTKMILFIVERIHALVKETWGDFEFTLVTNGSLLTKRTVMRLAAHGLSRARVTIDGPPDIHNFYRPFKNGNPSFEAIIKNIKDVCEIIKVGIGGNFTQENYKRFPELLDLLLKNGLTPDKIFQVKFTQAMQTNNQFTNSEFQEGCACQSEPWVAEATLFLREEILKRGFRTPKIAPGTCMVEVDDSFAVHLDGSLYKCTALIGHKNYVAGEVWNGFNDYKEAYGLNNWRENEKCRECKYLPLCFGGCRYGQLQKDGHMQKVNCMEGFYSNALSTMLQQDVKYSYGAP